MKTRNRRFTPSVSNILERRRLLTASVTSFGLQQLDFAGPTAAVGPGGEKNLEIRLNLGTGSQLPRYADITGGSGSGFEWTYGVPPTSSNVGSQGNPNVNPDLAILSDSTPGVYDLYLSPTVLYVNPSTGAQSTIQLTNGTQLSVTVSYVNASGSTETDNISNNPSLVVAGLSGQSLADAVPTATSVEFDSNMTTLMQSTNSNGYYQFVIPLTSNISGAPFVQTSATQLSDIAGLHWNNDSYGRPELALQITNTSANGNYQATVAFPAMRDEAGTDMTFLYELNDGSGTEHLTTVVVPSSLHTTPTSRDPGSLPNAQGITVAPVAGQADIVTYTSGGKTQTANLQNLLGGAYGTITLSPGTYNLDESLDISSGLTLQGNSNANTTLNFTASTYDQGAILLDSSHITLDDFAITFSQSDVKFTNFEDNPNSAGTNLGDVAVINAFGYAHQGAARVDQNVENLAITAPYDNYFAPDTNDESDYNPSSNPPINTVFTYLSGPHSSGTFSSNVIHGGTVSLDWGPWAVNGNQFLGPIAGTQANAAFSLYTAHDVSMTGNHVSNSAYISNTANPNNGYLLRLMAANYSGYNINISGNFVSNHVGYSPMTNGQNGNPVNSLEDSLFEDYGKAFEGSIAATAISSDRRVISIPSSEANLFPYVSLDADSLALYILDGSNVNSYVSVTQSFAYTYQGISYTYFVLQSPIPTGTFDFSIDPSYQNLVFSNNNINTSGEISFDLALDSSMTNTIVTGNTFTGTNTTETSGVQAFLQNEAISVNPGAKYPSLSYIPIYVNVYGNTFDGPRVALDELLSDGAFSTRGRNYAYVKFNNNSFSYNYSDSNIIRVGVSDLPQPEEFGSAIVGGSAVPEPSTYPFFVDPASIHLIASGNTIMWSGVTPPSNDVLVSASTINGSEYEYGQTPTPALLIPVSPGPLTFQFASSGTTVISGDTLATNMIYYGNNSYYGLTSPLSNDVNADSASVYGSTLTFEVQLAPGTYLVTPTLGYQGNASDSAGVKIQGAYQSQLNTGSSSASSSYIALVPSNGSTLTLEFDGSGPNTIVHLQLLTITPLQFQFDPTSAPNPMSGITPVDASLSYSSSIGYGFITSNPMDANGAVASTDMTFQLKLPAGVYDVTPTIGDTNGQSSPTTEIKVQGISQDIVTTGAGQTSSASFLATVGANGILVVEVDQSTANSSSLVYLSGLSITPRQGPLNFQFGPRGTTPATGSDLVTNYSYDSSGEGYGWTISAGQYVKTNPSDHATEVYANVEFFQVDNLPNGAYSVVATLGGTGNNSDSAIVALQGDQVAEPSDGATVSVGPFVATVVNGQLVLGLASAIAGDFVGIESLTITPLTFSFNVGSQAVPNAAYGTGSQPTPYAPYGVTPVSEFSDYPNGYGFGFSASNNQNAISGQSASGQPAHAVYATTETFQVNVQDGIYNVDIVLIGSNESGDNVNVFLQNNQVGTVPSSVTGEVEYDVPVENGVLSVKLTATNSNTSLTPLLYLEVLVVAPIGVVNNYDGTGNSDFAIYDNTNNTFQYENVINSSNSTPVSFSSFSPNTNDCLAVSGDFDGDGKSDYAVYDEAAGKFYVMFSAGGSATVPLQPSNNGNPLPGPNYPVDDDLFGDGQTDYVVYNQWSSTFFYKHGANGTMETFGYSPGGSGDVYLPVAADFDGDGKSDFALWDQTNGHFYYATSSSGFTQGVQWPIGSNAFGLTADKDVPVSGDFNDDGKSDFAIYDPVYKEFFEAAAPSGSSSQAVAVPVGSSNGPASSDYLVPLAGDYFGDGVADFAVFDYNTNVLYFYNPNTHAWYKETATFFVNGSSYQIIGNY